MTKYRVMMSVVCVSSFEYMGYEKWGKDFTDLNEAIVEAISLCWCEAVETEIWEISGRGKMQTRRPKVVSHNWGPRQSIDDPPPQSVSFSLITAERMQSGCAFSLEEAMEMLGLEWTGEISGTTVRKKVDAPPARRRRTKLERTVSL